MWRSLLLILILFGSTAFSQTENRVISDPQRSYKFDEIGNVSEKNWKGKIDKLLLKQKDNCEDTIYLIIYGDNKGINSKAKKYGKYLYESFAKACEQMPRKIIVVRETKKDRPRVEIWISPPYSYPPI